MRVVAGGDEQHRCRLGADTFGVEQQGCDFGDPDDAEPPKWFAAGPVPDSIAVQVTMTLFLSGWCAAMNLVHERTNRSNEKHHPPNDKIKEAGAELPYRSSADHWISRSNAHSSECARSAHTERSELDLRGCLCRAAARTIKPWPSEVSGQIHQEHQIRAQGTQRLGGLRAKLSAVERL